MDKNLKYLKADLQQIVDCCGDPIVVYDVDGCITYINPAFERVFGWSSREIMGKRIDFVPESVLEQTRIAVEQTIAGTAVLGMETIRKTKSRGEIPVRLSAGALKRADGLITGMVVTLQDITDLVRSRGEALVANKAKGDFLSNISHEIRTPMNGLMGIIDLIRKTPLDDEQLEYMEILQKSATDLMSVINDLLDFSKIDSGENDCNHIDFDVRTVMDDVHKAVSAKVEKKGLRFAVSVHPHVPALLTGDPEKLRQILNYLLDNAVKFTHEGSITVTVGLVKETSTHAVLRFEVADTGIGIESDQFETVFDSFSQVDSSATRKYSGTGIGLSLSRQLVHIMGGKIDVKSTLGYGSIFGITLEFEKQQILPQTPIQIPATIKGKKVFIIDDDAASRLIVKEVVKSWGCIQEEAASATRALEKLSSSGRRHQKFDIALINMTLPGMDGETLARHIRSNPGFSEMILIMLSSEGKRGDVARLKEIGVQGYLPKPLDASVLFDCITTAIAMQDQKNQEVITRHFLREHKKHRTQILLVEPGRVNGKIVKNILNKSGYRVEISNSSAQARAAFETGRFNLVLVEDTSCDPESVETIKMIREIEARNCFEKTIILVMTAYCINPQDNCRGDDTILKPITAANLLGTIEKWTQARQESPFGKNREIHRKNIFNLEGALERAMEDKAFLEMVVDEFIKGLPEKLGAMKSCILKKDSAKLTKEAHTLRGSASTIGADRISAAALELEKTGDMGDFEPAHNHLALLEKEYQRFVVYIKTINWSGI